MKTGFWMKDWFLGLVVTLVLLASGSTHLIQSLERTAYDWGVRASSRTPSDKVVVIAIDDASIRNIGRWPWSREVHAKMTEALANAKAKVIGNIVFFSEPQVDAGFGYISKLLEIYGRLVPTPAGGEPAPDRVVPERRHGMAVPRGGQGTGPGPSRRVVPRWIVAREVPSEGVAGGDLQARRADLGRVPPPAFVPQEVPVVQEVSMDTVDPGHEDAVRGPRHVKCEPEGVRGDRGRVPGRRSLRYRDVRPVRAPCAEVEHHAHADVRPGGRGGQARDDEEEPDECGPDRPAHFATPSSKL